MFDALKNLGNLPGVMAKAREMQDKMKAMQEELAKRQVSADAGGGIVTAIVNGRMELVKLRIDKSKIDIEKDTELLEDVIVAAVAAAQNKAAGMMQQEMSRITSEMGLPPGMLPGM
jgi:nucleoid-associated protein EbfC